MKVDWKTVLEFEKRVADFFGSPYAVATDCCTHAIELCLRLATPNTKILCPQHTYISVPMTFMKLGLDWEFNNEKWIDSYTIENTNIVDGAVLWEEGCYKSGTYTCLSFHYKKVLSLGKGGMILCDNYQDWRNLKSMTADGKDITDNNIWTESDISTIGYHYYMTPETAQLGIDKLASVTKTKTISWQDYPDLKTFSVFDKT